jgi:hypothetical protein
MRARADVTKATQIAKRLYLADRARYRPIFEFMNSTIKKSRRADLALRCVEQLEEREARGAPVADVRAYLAGTLRRLLGAEEAVALRRERGGENFLAEFTSKIVEAIENADRSKSTGRSRCARGQQRALFGRASRSVK